MANRTVIVQNKPESDDDATALWIVLLVAFGAVLIAIVGFNNHRTEPNPISAVTQQATR